MTKIIIVLFVCLLILAFGDANTSQAESPTQIFVDATNGNDFEGCGGFFSRCKSLQRGIEESSSGLSATQRSAIYVFDGVYGGSGLTSDAACQGVSVQTAILVRDLDYLTIAAFPGQEPVIMPTTQGEIDIVSLSIENSHYLRIDNLDSVQSVAQFDNWHVCNADDLTVRNSNFTGGTVGIDFNSGISNVLIENNSFVDINSFAGGDALDFSDGSTFELVIEDNYFKNNSRHITINPQLGEQAAGIIIRRNVLEGTTSGEAIRLNDGGGALNGVFVVNNVVMNSMRQNLSVKLPVSNIFVRHNTFFMGFGEEIKLSDAAAEVSLVNNIIFANGSFAAISSQAPFLPGPLLLEDYNLVFNNGLLTESGADLPVTLFGPNTITGMDPRFANSALSSPNLHLLPSSPALAAGLDIRVFDDNEQNPRPNPVGSSPDLGAYEMDSVIVDNEGPLSFNVGAYPNPVAVGEEVTFSATVDDRGRGDSDIASAAYRLYQNGISLVHTDPMVAVDGFDSPIEDVVAEFAKPVKAGIYELCISGSDQAGNRGPESCMMLVIYDPSAGFVTGGGWIVSPPGACEYGSCDPTTTGKANFGFVAKYKNGSLKPGGNTQFVFDAGRINFHSTEYDWLVLSKSGGQAQFKGSGSINGLGAPNGEDYKFILRAGDGGAGNLVPDTFSIKIWWEEQAVDHVVYDTGREQPIAGGSIIIHTNNR